mgnify:CR=1 FL=1
MTKRIDEALEMHRDQANAEMAAVDKLDKALEAFDLELETRIKQVMADHTERRVRISNALEELNRRIGMLPIPGPEPVERGIKVYEEPMDDDDGSLPSVLSEVPTLPKPKTTPPSLVAALKGKK